MIREVRDIQEVIPFLQDGVVFLDFDNTLVETGHFFGSEAWEKFLIQEHLAAGIPKKIAFRRSQLLWSAVQFVASVQWVQKETEQLFQILEEKQMAYAILTARNPSLMQATERQICSIFPSWSPEESKDEEVVREGVVAKGKILCCGECPKGIAIQAYLKRKELSPKNVIMIDDRKEHLLGAWETLKDFYSFQGFRYGCLDHKMESYFPDKTAELFHQMVLHPEATRLLLQALSIELNW